jgi:hypothetical protein
VTGTRIVSNQFDNIYAEGIVFESMLIPGLNASGHNIFYDVGNHFLGAGNPFTSIIDIQSNNNISVADMSSRNGTDSAVVPRVQLNNSLSIAINNGIQLLIGAYSRVSGRTNTLINDTAGTVIVINATVVNAFKIDYTIERNYAYRTGTITVATDVGDSSSGLSFSDDYVENNDTGITLSVSQAGDIVSLTYVANELGVNGSITSSYTFLA